MTVLVERLEPYSGPFPIDCYYHFKLHGKQLDSSNTAFLMKLVEDGLVRSGFIPDDSPKYVRWTACRSDKAKKGERQVVEVVIAPNA